ncbi:LysM peptidoglycan-binding domain-containing protein [Croceiramulus getboli]|nr:LysM peptidoglycan-binding domain-containing protein [Flavobacteriaceae bacterium YJPT1-3]
MKQFTILFLFVFMIFGCASAAQKQYASHRVKAGESVESIAEKYNLTTTEIYRYNPEARDGVYEGMVLVLNAPKGTQTPTRTTTSTTEVRQADQQLEFITHRVKKQETLFSLSQRYKVPQEVIKKYNTQLYAKQLQKGDRIQIPTNYEAIALAEEQQPQYTTHKVLPKETKWGLSQMYGISIAQLEELNPEIVMGLKEGMELKVPAEQTYATDAVLDENYSYYEVKPGEGYYSLLPFLGVTLDELTALNPALEDGGLKAGMVLKLPKSVGDTFEATAVDAGRLDLEAQLTDFTTKNIAVMLPFNLNRIGSDSTATPKRVIKDDRVMRIALDFHSGVLMAIDSAKALGLSTNLYVYDTQYNRRDGAATNARKIQRIINENNLQDVDAVIGPLLSANVQEVGELLKGDDVPVISPISPEVRLISNVFQSRPADAMLRDKMLEFIKTNGVGKNIIIIADADNKIVKSKLLDLFPEAKVVEPRLNDDGQYYLYPEDIDKKISDVLENWVIMETNDIPLLSNATTDLNTLVNDKKITLLTTNKGNAYDSDELSNMHLMRLNFHFPSVDKEFDRMNAQRFIERYEEKYGVTPNSYAVRGFDVTYDTLLRLAVSANLYETVNLQGESEHVENKFNYARKPLGGYYNQAVYILRYAEDLKLEEVETNIQPEQNEMIFKQD